jgi:hypothetical protein
MGLYTRQNTLFQGRFAEVSPILFVHLHPNAGFSVLWRMSELAENAL